MDKWHLVNIVNNDFHETTTLYLTFSRALRARFFSKQPKFRDSRLHSIIEGLMQHILLDNLTIE